MANSGRPFVGYGFRELVGHKKRVYTLAWNYSGKRLASGSADNSIRIWAIEPHCQVARAERSELELKGHNDTVTHVSWKPNSNDVLCSTTDGDKTMRFWDVRSGGKCTGVVNVSAGNMYTTWSPDGTYVAVVSKENTVSIVDVRKQKVSRSQRFSVDLNQVYWGPTNNHFMFATSDGSVDVATYPSFEPIWSLKGHSGCAYCFAVSKDQKYLVSGGADALLSLWDLTDMVCVRTWAHMDNAVRDASFSADSRYIAYTTEQSEMEVLSTRTGERVLELRLKAERCDCIAWHPVHPLLAYADDRMELDNAGRYERVPVITIFAPPKNATS